MFGLYEDGCTAARADRRVRRVSQLDRLLEDLGPVPYGVERAAVIALSRGRFGLAALRNMWIGERLEQAELLAAGSTDTDADVLAFWSRLIDWATRALSAVSAKPWIAVRAVGQAHERLQTDRAIHRRRRHMRQSRSRPPGRRDIFQVPAP